MHVKQTLYQVSYMTSPKYLCFKDIQVWELLVVVENLTSEVRFYLSTFKCYHIPRSPSTSLGYGNSQSSFVHGKAGARREIKPRSQNCKAEMSSI